MKPCLTRAVLLLVVFACACPAWNPAPHRTITKAALDSLPERFRALVANETPQLIEVYCLYPDRYVAMQYFGFTRDSARASEASDIHAYCERPDGRAVHSATWDRDEDLESIVYLFERILTSLNEKRPGDAAKFMGTLSHFISDSLSPPHAVSRDDLQAMAPAGTAEQDWHAAIERTLPPFDLGHRKLQSAGTGIMDSVSAILERIYTEGERNRKDLPAMVRAAIAKDERALDTYRLRAGRAAAEILADNLNALFTMTEQ